MGIRRDPIYVSNAVWRALYVLAQSRFGKSDEQGQVRTVTADEMADTLLRETLEEHYPQIFDHQKQVAKMEKDLIKIIGGTK